MTLELWSDPEGDGELSCCSAQAVRGARALAHELGIPHFSIDLREEFRAGVVDGWLQAHHDGGLTPNPCVACNGHVRLDAMLELAERLGAADARHRPLRPRQRGGPAAWWQATARKDQSYVLSALSASIAGEDALPARLDAQDRGARAGRAGRAGGGPPPRLTGPVLPRGHRPGAVPAAATAASAGAPGRSPTSAGWSSASTRRATCSPSVSATGSASPVPEPLYVLGTDAATNTVTVGPARRCSTDELPLRELTLLRDGGRVDGVRVRAHGRLHRCRLDGRPLPGEHGTASCGWSSSMERTAPGQIACLYDGEQVVGHAKIAAATARRAGHT